MIASIMFLSLVGTVLLIGVCTPLVPAAPVPNLSDIPSYIEEAQLPRFSMEHNEFFSRIEVNEDMTSRAIRDMMRQGIIEKSIQILRRHGMSEEKIRKMILNDFCIDEKTLEEIMNAKAN